jgi:hypothetical protein
MSSFQAGEEPRKSVTRPELIAVLAAVVFVISAMLRQYREITIPVSVALAAWAAFLYFRRPSRA